LRLKNRLRHHVLARYQLYPVALTLKLARYRVMYRYVRFFQISVEKTVQTGVAHAGASSKSESLAVQRHNGGRPGVDRHFSLRLEHILPDASARCLIAATLWNGFLQLSAFA
jgi:hypothetical protein